MHKSFEAGAADGGGRHTQGTRSDASKTEPQMEVAATHKASEVEVACMHKLWTPAAE
jgi:hypothetical protein